MTNYSPTLNIMMKATRKSARGLLRDFGELGNLQVSEKSQSNFVSTADLRSERVIMEELEKARPGYSFLSEEAGEINNNSEYRWIIDPLDGTTNFLHALPFFCISLALEKRISEDKSEIIAAIIDAPALGETYIAEKGGGAWLETYNSSLATAQRLRVSARKDLSHALIGGGFDFDDKKDLKFLSAVSKDILPIRMMGSCALSLAYLAAGRYDIYYKKRQKFWDVAAGILLIKEAGGIITDTDNNEYNSSSACMIASNYNLRKDFMKYFN
ncbi:MAG: inositol monophosphatase family protein [Alphaproteobacteria bacterium]